MKYSHTKILSAGCILLSLAACSDNNNTDTTNAAVTKTYAVKITNLTQNQPMSPPAAILHDSSFSVWNIGTAASSALEMLAEGGSNGALLALQSGKPQFDAGAPLAPGGSINFTLSSDNNLDRLTIAAMLVNTNDAFTGLNGRELSQLSIGQTMIIETNVYDAGTENNTELAGTMPGPADGGEGFNALNDDITQVVTLHGGVVTSDDGYNDSVLNESHRFDNPAMRISITAM